MIIVFLNPKHPKNLDAIKRMCMKTNTVLEITNSLERCKKNNYDLLISNEAFFNPNIIPSNIKIIFGPQCFVLPWGPIVGTLNEKWLNRCAYNVLCPWNTLAHLEVARSMVIPTIELPYAIDTEKFQPVMNHEKTFDCLLYFKERHPDLLEKAKKLLEQINISYKIIVYGKYKETDYIHLLHNCKFMFVIDRHESQGFGLQEAMACNVPLVVFDVKSCHEIYGWTGFWKYKKYKLYATAVPYWSETCGLKTVVWDELPNMLEYMKQNFGEFKPREFILEHLSEEKCMERITNFYNK